MSKRMLALVTATLALAGCGSLVGPDESELAANAAKAKQALDAAAQPGAAPTLRIGVN